MRSDLQPEREPNSSPAPAPAPESSPASTPASSAAPASGADPSPALELASPSPASAPPMAPMPAPRRKRRRIGLYVLLVLLAVCAYAAWRESIFRRAIRETEDQGVFWFYDDPLDAIKADWRALFRAGTWSGKRMLVLMGNPGVESALKRNLVARLRPRDFTVSYCDNVEAIGVFEGIADVRRIEISDCHNLKDLEALRGSGAVEELYLKHNQYVASLEFLMSLPNLRKAAIQDCDSLPMNAVNALKTALPRVEVGENVPNRVLGLGQ